MRRRWWSRLIWGAGLLSLFAGVSAAQEIAATAENILKGFVPRQRDVEYETPKPAEFARCTVKAERVGKGSAWVVTGPNGQVLRRIVDTDGDSEPDQWRYYNNGIEVYREIDTNFNKKPDQYRWLNTGGSRWGVDTNEDRLIDSWKVLSAEEASRVAVNALLANDADMLRLVLVNADDLAQLKIEASVQKAILANVSSPAQKLRDVVSKTKSLTPKARWMRFDAASAMPSSIPADDGKAAGDLILYENAMAIIETEGTPPRNSLLVQIGEIVKVGDVWKLTQIPQPIDGNQVQLTAGVLMQPPQTAGSDSPAATSAGTTADPRVAALVKQLQELDSKAPSADAAPTAFVKFNTDRAALLRQLIGATAKEPKEQENWLRQLVDGLTSAVQTGVFADGLTQLKLLETQLKPQLGANSPLTPYIAYRRMLAEYSVAVQSAKTSAAQGKVQEEWIKDLQAFVEEYPKAEDAPDAMIQLATGLEFAGKVGEARKWFKQLAEDHPKTMSGKKAAGAITRLEVKGKPLPLSFTGLDGGKVDIRNYRDKAVLVVFWATWCKPCFEDLPKLKALYQQYRAQGFEVIGVNLDNTTNGVKAYMQQNGMTWPQIHEPGGLESPPSLAFGVISLPTMFLVDKKGSVHSRPASIEDVKAALPEALDLKKPMATAGAD
jgi:thiol-disulfide isomerase/thioredoxin